MSQTSTAGDIRQPRFDWVAATIAWRYLRTRKRRFAAFITWVCVAGLSMGVLVLTVVVSVMNGFDAELKQRILGTVPHIVLPGRQMSEPGMQAVTALEGVVGAYDFFLGAGMVTKNGAVNPVTVYGIDSASSDALLQIGSHMIYGSLRDLAGPGREIILGSPLAAHLALLPGDSVALIVSEPTANGLRPRMLRFRLVGTFELGAELDYSLAIVDLSDLAKQHLAAMGTLGVRLTLANPLLAEGIARQLDEQYPTWIVKSWAENYGELFRAVRLEKALMFLILLMVVAVAAFNIVSGQMMVVTDKRSDIAILRTMGASAKTILQAFMLQGIVISSIGIVVGLVCGVISAIWITEVLALMKSWFGFSLLEGTYFVEVPSLILGSDLWLIGILSWCLCLVSAWLPAHRAAQLNPIEGLHTG
jgi:lipoprotein-releasing system permease protein